MNKVNNFTKKRIIAGILVFLLISGICFAYLNHVFSIGNSDSNRQIFKAFYSEEKNTIDAIYFGTSATNRYFINPMAYNETGATIFSLATMGMPLFFVPNLIEEAEKTQDPDLYIIELRWVLKERDQVTDAHIRRVTDNMKLSPNKIHALDRAFDFMDGSQGMLGDINENYLEYLVPIIKYHSKLELGELKRGDFSPVNIKNKTKGYIISKNTLTEVNQFPSRLVDKEEPLTEEVEATLKDLLDCCDGLDKDKKVLFVMSPYSVKSEQMPVFNSAIKIVEDRGYTVLNFNTEEMYEELDLDFDKDFYNSKHVNYKGAEKYTKWLTQYINSNYDLEDHRNDPKYESWEEAYDRYKTYTKGGIKIIGHKEKIDGKVTYIK